MLSTRKDIVINARRESRRMRHYYMGVEHLFIGLLQIEGGLASCVLEKHGQKPERMIDNIRRKCGKGSKRVLWPGIPATPRAEIVLGIAAELAMEEDRAEIEERDLLLAILEEENNIPTRVLKSFHLDVEQLKETTLSCVPEKSADEYYIRITHGPAFDPNHKFTKEQHGILERVFHGYMQIRIERALTGYTSALILVVTPIDDEGREDAAVVVKIDHADNILDEAQRYHSHVKGALPLLTARLEDNPVAPEGFSLAGLKYTLVANTSLTPQDLRTLAQDWMAETLGGLLHNQLYKHFGKTWWKRQCPYRFQMWKEYDWALPPTLTLDIVRDETQVLPENRILRAPVNRMRMKDMFKDLDYGELVGIDNFTVQRVDQQRGVIKLAAGFGMEADKRAYKIEVRGFDPELDDFFPGEVVERITGTIWKTRHDILTDAAHALSPGFDLRSRLIPFGDGRSDKLPNPLIGYETLLDIHINGSLSKVHGDLHLGNIVVGPNDSAWLIDFAHTRDGHTLFDWATLEVSLLSVVVTPVAGETWEAAQNILRHIAQINMRGTVTDGDPAIIAALAPVMAVRKIVRDCLYHKNDWSEYYIALALCALRAIVWETMSTGSRRLMFLLSALAMRELERKTNVGTREKTPTPDATDTIPSVSAYEARKSGSGSSIVVETVSESQNLWQSSQLETSTISHSTPMPYGAIPTMGTAPLHDPFGETENLADKSSIQFSAHYSNEVIPEEWYPLHIYVFRAGAAEAVSEDIERVLNVQWAARPHIINPARKALLEDEPITVVPYLEGFQFNPRFIPIDFFDDWQHLDFKMRAKKASTRRFTNGFITFSVEGIIVGNIPISIAPTETLSKSRIIHSTCDLYTDIYTSFSPQDSNIIERLERFSEAVESEYILEVMKLRGEPEPDAELQKLMNQANIFELFWSPTASKLPLVEKEWRHALSLNRSAAHFIRPVYWSQPMPPLPPELEHLACLYQPDLGM